MKLRNRRDDRPSPVGVGVRFLRERPSTVVPLLRRETELSVERPLGSGGVARLTARFAAPAEGRPPTMTELRAALDELTGELDALVGAPLAAAPVARPDREVRELIETYRPRQRELLEVLRDDGELTSGEYARLRDHLERRGAEPAAPPPARPEPVPEAPIAAAPLAAERSLPPARPVPELLETFQITSLKQAGAVRARRQISFAEYMALKRHFESAEPGSGRSPGPE